MRLKWDRTLEAKLLVINTKINSSAVRDSSKPHLKLESLIKHEVPASALGTIEGNFNYGDGKKARDTLLLIKTTHGDKILSHRSSEVLDFSEVTKDYDWESIPRHLITDGE